MKNLFQEINDWWKNTTARNKWFRRDGVDVYIRRANRYIDGKMVTSFDVANIEVRKQRKGSFTKFLDYFEQNIGTDIIYVESVLNPVLYPYLERRGYILHTELSDDFSKTYYKYL